MTPLEKAFNALVLLLCQDIARKNELIAELEKRPTRESLAAAEQRALRAGDELAVLRQQNIELQKQVETARRKPR